MNLPEPISRHVSTVADLFAASGHRLYLVGGPVRDAILGRPLHDIDLTTDAVPDVVRRLLAQAGPSAVFDVGARFGTIGAIFPTADRGAWPVEITTFRTEHYADGTRKPEVQFGVSLDEDLWRRDFTMNAIAIDLLDGTEHDPTGGRADIAAGCIRAVGDAKGRFDDDPLRLLRAVRFAAQLGFAIEPETEQAICEGAAGLARISKERIAAELNLILASDRAASGLRATTDLGLMSHVIPDVVTMRGMSQRPMHHKDVFDHTLGVVDNLPRDASAGLRWAALLHDIGKPATKSVLDGAVHFFGHEEVGARMARRIMLGLKQDATLITRVVALVRNHLRINAYEPSWTDAAVRRLIREVDPYLDELIALSRADVTSYRQEKRDAAGLRADDFARRAAELMAQQDIAKLQSPLDGDALMAMTGRPPGPWIRPVKEYLLGLVLDGELGESDVDTARVLAMAFMDTEASR